MRAKRDILVGHGSSRKKKKTVYGIQSDSIYSLRNPTSPVTVIGDTESGKAILRRKTNDFRLKHNRSK